MARAAQNTEAETQERQRLRNEFRDGLDFGFWANVNYPPCADDKCRPTQPGIFPLAHGVPGRVGLLRGYGNAIVPQVAAAFVVSAFEAIGAAWQQTLNTSST